MIHPQIRVYTKKPGETPDFEDGIILRNGVTVKHVCHAIHRTLPAVFKFALVWVSWKQRCAFPGLGSILDTVSDDTAHLYFFNVSWTHLSGIFSYVICI